MYLYHEYNYQFFLQLTKEKKYQLFISDCSTNRNSCIRVNINTVNIQNSIQTDKSHFLLLLISDMVLKIRCLSEVCFKNLFLFINKILTGSSEPVADFFRCDSTIKFCAKI